MGRWLFGFGFFVFYISGLDDSLFLFSCPRASCIYLSLIGLAALLGGVICSSFHLYGLYLYKKAVACGKGGGSGVAVS